MFSTSGILVEDKNLLTLMLFLSSRSCFTAIDVSSHTQHFSKKSCSNAQGKRDFGSEGKPFSPWYSLGSSLLLHLWFGPLSLISHPGALQLPNQGQHLSCGFIPASPVDERAVSLEDKIRVLKRSQYYGSSNKSRAIPMSQGCQRMIKEVKTGASRC